MAGPWENYASPDRAPLQITVRPQGQQSAQPSGDGPWSRYAAQKTPEVGVAEDVFKSVGGGLGRGTADLVGLPNVMDQAADWVVRQTVGRAVNAAKSGGQDWSSDQSERMQTGRDLLAFPDRDTVQRGIEGVTGPLYEPQTTYGEYASNAARFVPGTVMAPAQGAGLVSNAIKYGVVPGLTSEAAGQATKGTAYEPVARVGGALAGAGVSGLASRPSTASRAIREAMPDGVTPQMVDDAARLMDDAAQQGITLAWPEALSQVAGRPVLTNAMRHLEAAPQTEARMAQFFGDRARQVEGAARPQFNNIAPVNRAPSTIGPAVGGAAEDTANAVRGAINRNAEPLYTAAAPEVMDPATMAQIRRAPGWAEARDAVRNNAQLNRYVENLPDDSIGFLNEVQKLLRQQADNAAAPVNQQRNMQISAGLGMDGDLVRNAATRQSPRLAQAIGEEAANRTRFLDPLLQGPLGKIASRDTTTKAAINALFPANPLANSADEIATTVSALAVRNPRAARDLVRAHVETTFNEAAQSLQTGANQAGGAKFRAALVGNSQQAANLEAAVRALPNGNQIWPGFNRFLEVLEATGTRQGVGSRTAYNAEILKNAATSGIVGETAKGAANPLRGLQFIADRYERYRLGSNMNELADILTNPRSANQLRAIARMPPGSGQAAAVAMRLVNLTNSSTRAPVGQPK